MQNSQFTGGKRGDIDYASFFREVEDYGSLMKGLTSLAKKKFGLNNFKLVSQDSSQALLDDGDDLECAFFCSAPIVTTNPNSPRKRVMTMAEGARMGPSV